MIMHVNILGDLEVGDLCLVKDNSSEDKNVTLAVHVGMPVFIMDINLLDDFPYYVSEAGKSKLFACKRKALVKLEPPSDPNALGTWDACPWTPKELKVS
jgi:hypothetical protein